MLAIAGIEIDHSEIQQMIAGEAQRLDAALLFALLMMDLSFSHDLDHIPRYVLVGDGRVDSWDTFRYIDDLSRMPSAAIDMKSDVEEITSVVAYDLDDEGKEVATYSEDS